MSLDYSQRNAKSGESNDLAEPKVGQPDGLGEARIPPANRGKGVG